MLKSLLDGLLTNQDGVHPAIGDGGKLTDQAEIQVLVEHFALGKKLRYIPEFKKEIVFDTLVLGYRVNDEFIYSRDAIEFDEDGNPSGFLLGEKRTKVPLAKVRRFLLLVPDTTDQIQTLDYQRRAMLGRNQFAKGNTITLIASASRRGFVTLETEVAMPVTLKEGPYANTPLVLLFPEFETLNFVDNRKKSRTAAHVPVVLYPGNEGLAHGCMLVDFSEMSVHLGATEAHGALPVMNVHEDAILVVDLGGNAKIYTIRGVVLRSSADSCVLRLNAIHKNNQFVSLSAMDVLELKSGLLNFGA